MLCSSYVMDGRFSKLNKMINMINININQIDYGYLPYQYLM